MNLILWFFVFLIGCAQVTSLNLKKHEFGKLPTKIIWFQVEGLSPEHVALLKFSDSNQGKITAFENALCIGSLWEYDLYKLRPKAYAGFLSQITGKKNIKSTCSDYELKPIWKYVAKNGYKTGIFEGEMSKNNSLTKSLACADHKDYLAEAVVWSMNTRKNSSKLFHAGERTKFKPGDIYYDRSCKKNECFTTLSRNIEATFEQFSRNSTNYLYIVRNFKYASLLKKKRIKEAKVELNEINTSVKYFQNLAGKFNDVLVLVTSSNALDLNFPKSGKRWKGFEKRGKYLKINHSKLVSSVFATGARAENFCGIYGQNQVFGRIFSGAKQQGLEFSIINPFN